MTDGYDTDFHRWIETQAGLLRMRGREDAEAETGLPDLPESCPWIAGQVVDRNFWPGLPWESGDDETWRTA